MAPLQILYSHPLNTLRFIALYKRIAWARVEAYVVLGMCVCSRCCFCVFYYTFSTHIYDRARVPAGVFILWRCR